MTCYAVTGLTVQAGCVLGRHDSIHATEAEALAELDRLRAAGLISKLASTVYALPDQETP